MKIPDKIFGREIGGAMDRYLDSKKTAKKEKPKQVNLETSLDFWTIPNVEYRNGICTVDIAKQLLDNGNAKTQDEWVEYSKQAQQNNGFYAGDFPLYHAIFTTLFKNKDGSQKDAVEEIREFIKQKMIEKWLITLTRIRYAPKNQKNKVIHNYNMPDQYAVELDSFIGPDGFIEKTTKVEGPLQALLGTQQSIKEINSVYKWLTDVDAYLFRLNSGVQNVDESVAGFNADSGGAVLYCFRYPLNSNAVLGVRSARKKI